MFSAMSSANKDSFASSQVWIPFISFSSLFAVVRTSKTMLTTSGESGYPCLFLILQETRSSFRSECDVCCEFCSGHYYLEVGSLYNLQTLLKAVLTPELRQNEEGLL